MGRYTATIITPAGNRMVINLVDRVDELTAEGGDSNSHRLDPAVVAERLHGRTFDSEEAFVACVVDHYLMADGPWWVPYTDEAAG